MPKEIDCCNNWRPYAQAFKTMTLGCMNCGKGAANHDDVCMECSGTGKGEKADQKGVPDDLKNCEKCGGTGRIAGKVALL